MSELANPDIYRVVLEELLTGVYFVDCDQKVHFWNSGAERITGYLRQEMVGRSIQEGFLTASFSAEGIAGGENSPLVAAMHEGCPNQAEAYLCHKKGHSVPVMLRAIPIRNAENRVIGVAACFDENAAASEWSRRRDKLAEFGCLDEDTGVLNRDFVQTQLSECLDAFARHHVPFGVLFIAVDRMDYLRATYGQHAAAKILRAVGQTLENSLRPTDWLGRWSEDRFLAILTECSPVEFGKVGERLRKMVSCSETEWWGDKLYVTVSLGGAAAWQDDSIDSLLERAQRSLPENASNGAHGMKTAKDRG